jgi:hypothetical protein
MTDRRTVLVTGPAAVAAGLLGTTARRATPAGAAGGDARLPGPPRISRRPTYLFAQQHRDALPWWRGTWRPQKVVSGARLRIQLPGDPIRWVPHTGGRCSPTPWPGGELVPEAGIELEDHEVIPSPGRIAGAESLYQFDYRVSGSGTAVACLHPDPVPDSPEALSFPPGSPLTYALTVVVTA